MNCAANAARSSCAGSSACGEDQCARFGVVVRARLLSTLSAISTVLLSGSRTQHGPANQLALPNHRSESRSNFFSLPLKGERLRPKIRQRLLQSAADAHGADLARKPAGVVGLDRNRAHGGRAV